MKRRRTVASVHNDWLSLVEPVGAFLTLPVLKRVFPNGVPPVEADARGEVRRRLDDLGADVAARTVWFEFVLKDLLGYGDRLRQDLAVPGTLRHSVAERHSLLRPNFALVEPVDGGPDRVRLIGVRWPHRTALDERPSRDEQGRPTDWAATPIERASVLCRAVNVPLALVTDTDRFAIVWAPAKGPSGHAIFSSSLFGEERLLLDAFVAVLGAQRFFGVSEKETLEALLTESSSAQAEVTDRLGAQVRRAVELLVGAFSRAHRSSGEQFLRGVEPNDVYNAAVTVMMRLVVLMAAEERRLLPADDPIYSESYSVLTARDQLERDAMRDGIETLEKRHTAWHRLLATFRAVHGGIEHDRMRLAAYGGGLFDPKRYRFLDSPPIPVDDRTTLAVLDALQVLTFRQGGVTEARRLSYRNLSVEEIGNVYEGLLDHGCARVKDDVVLGIVGSKGEEPELKLSDLEREYGKGEEAFAEWLSEQGGPAASTTKKRLFAPIEPDWDHRLRVACDNDPAIHQRVAPFARVLREDLRELPAVFLPGSLYVTQTSLRRDSGTAYTTPELADEVVKYALEPLVYSPGPAEGVDPSEWKLKTSDQLLQLKVCDPAVGSGAILVAACRLLADRLVEAWQAEAGRGARVAALEGVSESEWVRVARQAVTDHCLYGVDRNPMALEMAKLSLWLTTMAKERPFTFLDHQVRCGDSLLGITSLDQVRWVHIDPKRGEALWTARPLFDARKAIDARVDAALDKARSLSAIDVRSLEDVEKKRRLHEEMQSLLSPLSMLADAAVGAALAAAGGEGAADEDDDDRPAWRKGPKRGGWQVRTDNLLAELADQIDTAFDETGKPDQRERALHDIRDRASYWLDTGRPELALDRRCLHWPLAFPEVFLAEGRSGFDAIVGNPPFVAGKRISTIIGGPLREYLVLDVADDRRGDADLVVYFLLRTASILQRHGIVGILSTKSIAQGESRRVGLDHLLSDGAMVFRAVTMRAWPGASNVFVCNIWACVSSWRGQIVLDDIPVGSIDGGLAEAPATLSPAQKLAANKNKSFQGSIPLGDGFVLSKKDADELISADARNREVVLPYLIGDDVNSDYLFRPSRYIICFRELSERAAATYTLPWRVVTERVKPWRATKDRRKYPKMVDDWWLFWNYRPRLYNAIKRLPRVLVIARTSNTQIPVFVPSAMIFADLVVFAHDDYAAMGVITSELHRTWIAARSSFKSDTRYTTEGYETFPFPDASETVVARAASLDELRINILQQRRIGLTELYKAYHAEPDADLLRLQKLHVELDYAVQAAYGWDIDLGHGLFPTPHGLRYTFSPHARNQILRKLTELNHQRHATETLEEPLDPSRPKRKDPRSPTRKKVSKNQIALPTE